MEIFDVIDAPGSERHCISSCRAEPPAPPEPGTSRCSAKSADRLARQLGQKLRV